MRRAEREYQQQYQTARTSLRKRTTQQTEVIPLSYIDEVNTLIPRSLKTARWHKTLKDASDTMKLKWDTTKDWEGKEGKHLGVYLNDERRHWRKRLQKARKAWAYVRRLTKLSPEGKRTIVCGQLLPILCYGCEVFEKPNEEMMRLARTWSRWVVGAWSGSNADKVAALSGIDNLCEIFRKRKIRWAASVYGRCLPLLREVAKNSYANTCSDEKVNAHHNHFFFFF